MWEETEEELPKYRITIFATFLTEEAAEKEGRVLDKSKIRDDQGDKYFFSSEHYDIHPVDSGGYDIDEDEQNSASDIAELVQDIYSRGVRDRKQLVSMNLNEEFHDTDNEVWQETRAVGGIFLDGIYEKVMAIYPPNRQMEFEFRYAS